MEDMEDENMRLRQIALDAREKEEDELRAELKRLREALREALREENE